ncbi:PD-(D/E)XK nuclease family transposase [Carnobacterium gallinarum]|uniref:PD-(D/E)XK nuclease family transposase n=1 Tax=Carnobacterium gallinarum TaxID=2749 RepID=UPI0005545E97|nr:PD-(D/E)XK nuclease family transposase [Carnobacterium gallinarum]
MIANYDSQVHSFLLTNELVFTKLFTTPENEELLKHFINDILGIQVTKAIPEHPYNFQSFKRQFQQLRDDGIWLPIIEASIEVDHGRWLILDLQKFPRHRFIQQIIYGAAGKFQEKYQQVVYAGKNQTQDMKKKFKSITYLSILDFNFFKQDNRLIYSFNFLDNETKEPLKETMIELNFFELKKDTKARFSRELRVKYWQELFLTGKVSSEAPIYLQEVAEMLKESSLTIEESELAKKITQSQEEFTEILNLIRANTDSLFKKRSN